MLHNAYNRPRSLRDRTHGKKVWAGARGTGLLIAGCLVGVLALGTSDALAGQLRFPSERPAASRRWRVRRSPAPASRRSTATSG